MSPSRAAVAETGVAGTGGGSSAPAASRPTPANALHGMRPSWLLGAAVAATAATATLIALVYPADPPEPADLARLVGVAACGAIILATIGGVCVRRIAELERARLDAEREVRASHNQLQELIDHTSANIYMKRVDNGRYLLVNREWERLFKVARDEVVHLTDYGVFPAALADQLRDNDLRVARLGRPVQYEETARTDEGERTYVSVKFPVFDAAGTPYAVCGISTDITERKQAEEEVRVLNGQLEERVRERTAELEALSRELDAFAYSVSHDLRAPLRSLHGFSEALLDDYGDALDETGRDYLHRLQTNVQRMGRMIDDLLNLSRTTRLELRREAVDLADLARDVLAELAAAEPDRTVTTAVADRLPASGDPRLLRLMLQNLLANAWKFTGKRPDPCIEVGTVHRYGDSWFFVRDNGAGFDMRYVDKLFTAFQRLHGRSDFEGTGLGLAIVARIVRRHGGHVFAEAELDRGATFYFSLTPPATALGIGERHEER